MRQIHELALAYLEAEAEAFDYGEPAGPHFRRAALAAWRAWVGGGHPIWSDTPASPSTESAQGQGYTDSRGNETGRGPAGTTPPGSTPPLSAHERSAAEAMRSLLKTLSTPDDAVALSVLDAWDRASRETAAPFATGGKVPDDVRMLLHRD